jgi:hypothetical protein
MTRPMNYVDPPDVPEGMTLREYRVDAVNRTTRRSRRPLLRRWLHPRRRSGSVQLQGPALELPSR